MKYMSKIYFEKYAQLTLGLTDFGDTFELMDKPDLQDCEHNVGIEVVVVETTEEGIKRSVWNQNIGQGLTSNEFRNKFQREDFKQSVIPDCNYMAMDCRCGEAKALISEMLEFIGIKNKKLANYKKFEKNGLYLFNCHMWAEQINELQQAIFKKNFEFDFYVVNLIDRLYVITNKEIKAYDISNEMVHDFKLVALEYEKKNH